MVLSILAKCGPHYILELHFELPMKILYGILVLLVWHYLWIHTNYNVGYNNYNQKINHSPN